MRPQPTTSEETVSSARTLQDRLFDFDEMVQSGGIGIPIIMGICLFALWHIATNVYLAEPGRWQNCIHFGGFALLAAVITGAGKTRARTLGNLLFGVLVCLASLWIAYAENGVYARTLAKTGQAWQFTWVDWASGILVLVGALELTRRLTGWIIPVLVLLSMAYILGAGQFLPGAFRAARLPIDDVLFRSLFNDEGIFRLNWRL